MCGATAAKRSAATSIVRHVSSSSAVDTARRLGTVTPAVALRILATVIVVAPAGAAAAGSSAASNASRASHGTGGGSSSSALLAPSSSVRSHGSVRVLSTTWGRVSANGPVACAGG